MSEKRLTELYGDAPKYAGIPVTRPQGMWMVYLDMLGVKWGTVKPEVPQETLMLHLGGKGIGEKTYAYIVANDFTLRKHQREVAQQMKDESMKAVVILGQAPEVLRAGIRKISYIRRGRNGLFHESAYINCKGEIQNLNNTTFISGFNFLPKETTTAYQTYSTDNDALLEAHNRAAAMAWKWNFDVNGRCIEVHEAPAPKVQGDEPIFIEKKCTGERPDDPTFLEAKPPREKDCNVSVSKERVVSISFTEEAMKKVTDTGFIRISAATEENPVIYFMEGGENDFALSRINKSNNLTRPYRAQPTAEEMAKMILRNGYKGKYDLTQVTTKSGTKYWCIKLETHNAK